MKLNNKGFAITAVLYGLLILFVVLVSSYLLILSARKNRVDNLIKDMEDEYFENITNNEINPIDNPGDNSGDEPGGDNPETPTVNYYNVKIIRDIDGNETIVYELSVPSGEDTDTLAIDPTQNYTTFLRASCTEGQIIEATPRIVNSAKEYVDVIVKNVTSDTVCTIEIEG